MAPLAIKELQALLARQDSLALLDPKFRALLEQLVKPDPRDCMETLDLQALPEVKELRAAMVLLARKVGLRDLYESLVQFEFTIEDIIELVMFEAFINFLNFISR